MASSFDTVTQTTMFDIPTREQRIVSRECLKEVLFNTLKGMGLEEFAHTFTNRLDAIFEYVALSMGENNVGNTISLLFNPGRLNVLGTGCRASIYGSFGREQFSDALARASAFFIREGSKTPLYHAINIGVDGVNYIHEFPPFIMRDLCYRRGLNSKSHVLDPCAGWGGRMIGASIVVDNYTGYEPSSVAHAGLTALGKWLQQFNSALQSIVHCTPFEEATPPAAHYDLAVTSPPYYDTEQYSYEETNSWVRYKTYHLWVEGFFKPLIDKTMAALKPTASFILNVGSRRYPLKKLVYDYCKGRYEVSDLGSFLSGRGGLRNSEGVEAFFEIKHLSPANAA